MARGLICSIFTTLLTTRRGGNSINSAILIMKTNRIEFGKRVKELRESAGLTQSQLAERAGVNRVNISKIEAGKYNVSLDIISRIASSMRTTVSLEEDFDNVGSGEMFSRISEKENLRRGDSDGGPFAYGFDSFEEAEEAAKRYGLQLGIFSRAKGQDVWWYGGQAFSAIETDPEDLYGVDGDVMKYNSEGVELFKENGLVEADNIENDFGDRECADGIRAFVEKTAEIDDDTTMRYLYDNKEIVIGLTECGV